jgi:hypothetical protein
MTTDCTDLRGLTVAEFKTIKTILVTGGDVVMCMGRIRGDRVNKRVVQRLMSAGLVTVAGAHGAAGPDRVDITVTAAGCAAFTAY